MIVGNQYAVASRLYHWRPDLPVEAAMRVLGVTL
jgi:hypothetical protein